LTVVKRLFCLLALVALAALPVRAGGFASSHGGGFGGGTHGYSGPSHGGSHGYSGACSGGTYYGGYRGFSGGYYAAYPYSYGYDSYGYEADPVDYSAPAVYGSTEDTPVYPYAPAAPPASVGPAPDAAPNTGSTAATPSGPLVTGKVDDFGFIHSPYTSTTFKPDKIAPGQIFYDPITGQPFTVAKPEAPAIPTTPTAPTPTPTTLLPAGKLDEFGYVHSPFSTFTFKVQNGNYAQVFRDPFTGQSFTVRPKEASRTAVPAVAGPAGAVQASD